MHYYVGVQRSRGLPPCCGVGGGALGAYVLGMQMEYCWCTWVIPCIALQGVILATEGGYPLQGVILGTTWWRACTRDGVEHTTVAG